ncbi:MULTISPECIES: IS66 family transposase [Burkholderia cepacia complex]|uniref:IS66 family transposase n=1 Tax=Burkholderia cepacia complex TaxID=87882 RepID=UPI0018AD1CD4|nr:MULTISPECIES: transposase [Burkholderia cepacia complex]
MLATVEHVPIEPLPNFLPSCLPGGAMQYMSSYWPKLASYVENGNWPIFNDQCENVIRLFAFSRKGWLFSDAVADAWTSANFYSFETCKANGIDTC